MASSSQAIGYAFAPDESSGRLGISAWLLLAFVVGICIVVPNGLSLPFIPDGNPPVEALTYEASPVAWIFAAVMFPLIFLHGARLRMKWNETLLLWFVLCSVAYSKDFAYLRVPGVPLFVTDITLAIIFVSIFVWPRLRIPRIQSVPMAMLATVFFAGTLAALRGLLGGQQALMVFRDYAMVVYALFGLVALHLGRTRENTKQLFLMLVVGQLLVTIRGVAWYVAQPGMRRYIPYATFVAIPVLWVAFSLLNKKIKPAIGWPVLFVLGIGVLIANARAAELCIMVGAVLLFFWGISSERRGQILKQLVGIALVLVLSGAVLLQTKVGGDYLARIEQDFVSGILQPENDANGVFRLLAWAEAARRFQQNPVLGEGFGVPFTFELSQEDMQTHNTFITVSYKMGLVGIIPLFTLLGYCFLAARRAVRLSPDTDASYMLRGLLLSQILLVVNGMVNPLLEIPFLGSLFWINFGLLWAMTRRVQAATQAVA